MSTKLGSGCSHNSLGKKQPKFMNLAAAIVVDIITDAAPQLWKLLFNSGKVTPPLKPSIMRGLKKIWPTFSARLQQCMCAFCNKKKRPKLDKYDCGSYSKKTLPHIGGHHTQIQHHSNRETGTAVYSGGWTFIWLEVDNTDSEASD